MTEPYRGVIKMHLMIFVFAGLHLSGATSFWFYAATLFVYFFPWRRLRRGASSKAIVRQPLEAG